MAADPTDPTARATSTTSTRPTLVLASGSPRRRAFLQDLGLTFDVRPADIDETPLPDEQPHAYVERLAHEKAAAVAHATAGSIVIAADTTVALDGTVIGKPDDHADAARILRSLAGRTHDVLSGVAVALDDEVHSCVVRTSVTFASLTDADIEWYVATGEPLDKAGAYAIQGLAAAFVRRIDGSVTNVIGLPLVELHELLAALGYPVSSLRG